MPNYILDYPVRRADGTAYSDTEIAAMQTEVGMKVRSAMGTPNGNGWPQGQRVGDLNRIGVRAFLTTGDTTDGVGVEIPNGFHIKCAVDDDNDIWLLVPAHEPDPAHYPTPDERARKMGEYIFMRCR